MTDEVILSSLQTPEPANTGQLKYIYMSLEETDRLREKWLTQISVQLKS